MARRGGVKGFLGNVLEAAPQEAALLDDPEVMEALEAGARIVFDDDFTAAEAIASEFSFAHPADPGAALGTLGHDVAVHLLLGPDDLRCPPETLAELERAYPRIAFHRMDSGGLLLFFRHWPFAIELLDRMAISDITPDGGCPGQNARIG